VANHKSDPLFLHPILHARLADILAEVKNNLPAGWKTGTALEGIHRTPGEQFTIFQKGRAFKDGSWVIVDKNKKVTGLDGYKKKSRHNYLPATAVDIVLFNAYQTLKDVTDHPRKFRLQDVSNPCIVLGTVPPAATQCSSPDRFLFWDGVHPTKAGHVILAIENGKALVADLLAAH